MKSTRVELEIEEIVVLVAVETEDRFGSWLAWKIDREMVREGEGERIEGNA